MTAEVNCQSRRPARCHSPCGARLSTLLLLLCLPTACAPPSRTLTPLERRIEQAARPILQMNPDAVWTDCYNELVELAPASIAYLAEHPLMRRRAAPDDLRVMLHTSLLRLLVHPATRPRVSVNCLETTLDVLHFDLKVDGRRIGTACLPEPEMPAAWHELYPLDCDHELAGRIDVEADRQALRRWWHENGGDDGILAAADQLRPRAENLWRLLSRRYADRWSYQPEPRAIRCGGPPIERTMMLGHTYDYNLVRAACVWLGSADQPRIRARLIDLVGSPSPVLVHNALLALQYVPDERIRDLIDRYKKKMEASPVKPPEQSAVSQADKRAIGIPSHAGQWSATHEMAKPGSRFRRARGGGRVYCGEVRQPRGSATQAGS